VGRRSEGARSDDGMAARDTKVGSATERK
jgi:hypothetical protein